MSKKKSTMDQFILQRRDQAPHDSTTGPSTQPLDDTSEKVVHESSSTTDSERTKSGNEATTHKVDKERGEEASTTVSSEEGMAVRAEEQAGSNPGKGNESTEDQAGPDTGESHAALAGPDPEPMHDDFYATPSGILSSMKNLDETDNFGDHFLNDNPTEDEQVHTSSPPLSTHVVDLTSTTPPPIKLSNRVSVLEKRSAELECAFTIQKKTSDNLSSRIFTLEHRDLEFRIDNYVHDAVKESVHMAFRAPLLQSFADSAQPPSKDSKQSTKKKLDSDASTAQQPLAHTTSAWKITDTRDATFDSLTHRSKPESEQSEHSFNDTSIHDAEHVSEMEEIDNSHLPKVQSTSSWFRPIPKEDRPATPEPEWTIPSNDYPEPENNWANVYATTYQDPKEKKLQRKMGDIGSFIKWFCKRTRKKKLYKADLEGPTFNLVDLVNPEGHQILRNAYEPLPLGGPPGDKERKTLLSISKLKAARYLDFGLEELVPSLWVKSERDYDISAAYGITHWWFRRKEFYINKHREPSDRDAVRSHMQILSVISIKTYERYVYNYLREIVLRQANYKEYKISKKDFKNLHPNDFEDLFLLHLQDKLNHLPKSDKVNLHTTVNIWIKNIFIRKHVEDLQLGVESYQTKLNLEQPNWDASDFLFKEDYTIVNKPRALIYRDRDDNKKMMRIDEVHKFSNGTLMRIREKLDFMVKDFRLFKFNKGMENRKWTKDDKRRSEDFIKDHLKMEMEMEMEIPSVKASVNSDIVYVFTSAQDGKTLQDDERFDLADDLIKAQVYNQRLVNDESKDH
ncbi:hypothetical protein Tco_0104348 [Tanacetum coccineum]